MPAYVTVFLLLLDLAGRTVCLVIPLALLVRELLILQLAVFLLFPLQLELPELVLGQQGLVDVVEVTLPFVGIDLQDQDVRRRETPRMSVGSDSARRDDAGAQAKVLVPVQQQRQ